MTRRILAALLLLTICLAAVPQTARAFDPFVSGGANGNCAGGSDNAVCQAAANPGKDNPVGPDGVIIKIANIVGYVAGAAAVILIVLGGIKYVTSNGDSSKISSAKNTIIYSLVGVAVIALAEVIITAVIGKL